MSKTTVLLHYSGPEVDAGAINHPSALSMLCSEIIVKIDRARGHIVKY
jgi:hypothetical protein